MLPPSVRIQFWENKPKQVEQALSRGISGRDADGGGRHTGFPWEAGPRGSASLWSERKPRTDLAVDGPLVLSFQDASRIGVDFFFTHV